MAQKKIIIISSEEYFTKVIARILTVQHHIDVQCIANGLKAFMTVQLNHPDAVIIDIDVKDIAPEKLAKMIKENPELADIKLGFIISKFQKRQMMMINMTVPVDLSLLKTDSSEAIVQNILNLLGKSDIQEAAPAPQAKPSNADGSETGNEPPVEGNAAIPAAELKRKPS